MVHQDKQCKKRPEYSYRDLSLYRLPKLSFSLYLLEVLHLKFILKEISVNIYNMRLGLGTNIEVNRDIHYFSPFFAQNIRGSFKKFPDCLHYLNDSCRIQIEIIC